MEFTGRPSDADVEATDSPFAATMMESCTVTEGKKMSELFPMASPGEYTYLFPLPATRLASQHSSLIPTPLQKRQTS